MKSDSKSFRYLSYFELVFHHFGWPYLPLQLASQDTAEALEKKYNIAYEGLLANSQLLYLARAHAIIIMAGTPNDIDSPISQWIIQGNEFLQTLSLPQTYNFFHHSLKAYLIRHDIIKKEIANATVDRLYQEIASQRESTKWLDRFRQQSEIPIPVFQKILTRLIDLTSINGSATQALTAAPEKLRLNLELKVLNGSTSLPEHASKPQLRHDIETTLQQAPKKLQSCGLEQAAVQIIREGLYDYFTQAPFKWPKRGQTPDGFATDMADILRWFIVDNVGKFISIEDSDSEINRFHHREALLYACFGSQLLDDEGEILSRPYSIFLDQGITHYVMIVLAYYYPGKSPQERQRLCLRMLESEKSKLAKLLQERDN